MPPTSGELEAEMSVGVSGIKGEFRRPKPEEIAMIVKFFRKTRGIKQASLAESAGVVERTLERLEAGKSVGLETYRRVATALGLDGTAFTAERYISTAEEALERLERQSEELERSHTSVPVSRITDPRQILSLFGKHALLFEDSKIKVEHLEPAAEAKQLIVDWGDIAPELDELGKLKAAKEVLETLRRIEALGYVVKIGAAESYPASDHHGWNVGLVVVFPKPINAHDSLPNEVLLKNEMKMPWGNLGP
jgi:transcriptional regulator with XRE-family HTH domain